MTNRRSDRLIITLPPEVIDRLRSRGARSDKTHGPYNYTQQLTRTLELYESVVVKSDPRDTRALPQEHYDLILDLVRDPQKLETFHIHRLGDFLLEVPAFAERVRGIGLDPGQLAATLNAYSFAEKLHLVDAAALRHPPPAPKPRGR
ncbi:MAG: hypothetical protein JOZ15_14850 [Acidobacteria bacterium]|nr:hypothetical protein [Acidobacteriota bacterium]